MIFHCHWSERISRKNSEAIIDQDHKIFQWSTQVHDHFLQVYTRTLQNLDLLSVGHLVRMQYFKSYKYIKTLLLLKCNCSLVSAFVGYVHIQPKSSRWTSSPLAARCRPTSRTEKTEVFNWNKDGVQNYLWNPISVSKHKELWLHN